MQGDKIEVLVVGGGIVGLACAARLARKGREVVVAEAATERMTGVSSRNSGVIHSGIYYEPGSLKATLCVRGAELLYERCARFGIGHRQTGKLIIATTADEVGRLEKLQSQGSSNGVEGLALLDAAALKHREPDVVGSAALFSPRTGIVDVHALGRQVAAEASSAGCRFSMGVQVERVETSERAATVYTADATEVDAEVVINATGLHADRIAHASGVDIDVERWRQVLCKGDYFRISGRYRTVTEPLLYPLPSVGGLGIHLTVDLAGQLRAGPDATFLKADALLDFAVAEDKASGFVQAVRRYYPRVRHEDFHPDYAGIRPKLHGPEIPFRDFVISRRGRVIHLIGIESPGLTASEAIAEHVVTLTDEVLS